MKYEDREARFGEMDDSSRQEKDCGRQDRAQLETGTEPLFLYIEIWPTDEEHIPIKTSMEPVCA